MEDPKILQLKREELETVVIEATEKAFEQREAKQKEDFEKSLDSKLDTLKASLQDQKPRDPGVEMGKFMSYLYQRDKKRDYKKADAIFKTLDPQDETTAADGGTLVPTITKPEIFRLMEEYGQARAAFRQIPMGKAAVLTLPSKLTGATVSRVSEGAQIADTKVTLTTMTLTASKVAAIVAFTNELMEDAIVDMGAYVNELLAEAFAQEEDTQMFAGTGSPHTGLFNTSATYGSNNASADGEIQVTNADAITYQDLVQCSVGLKSWYLRGAEWKMHRTVYGNLLKLVDDNGRPLITDPGNNRGELFGYPINLIETAPAATTTTAGMPLIILGNTMNSYMGIKRELTATILTEATVGTINLAEYDLVGIRVTKRDAFDDGLTAAYSVIKVNE